MKEISVARSNVASLVVVLSLIQGCHLSYATFDQGTDGGGTVDGEVLDAAARDDGGSRDAGLRDAGSQDAAPDSCVPGPELCDGADNDCDGTVDEGTVAELGCAWSCGPTGCSDPVVPAAGHRFTCSLLSGGDVGCWGDNMFGQLGDGSVADHSVPMAVSISDVESVATGASSVCALRAGRLSCWGDNWTGQLGDGSTMSSPIPFELPLTEVRAFDVGGVLEEIAELTGERVLGACAIVGSDRSVFCWGGRPDRETPTLVSGLSGSVEVAVGGGFACARDPLTSRPRCWGANAFGQLGNGTTTPSETPVRVSSAGGGVEEIAAGAWHACGLFTGEVLCWGLNLFGQCGQAAGESVLEPSPIVPSLSGVEELALGGNHSCALLGSGEVYCWGQNTNGQLGDGTSMPSSAPVRVSGVSTAVAITAGFAHSCATLSDRTMVCWGDNDFAQLGDDTTTQRTVPAVVAPLE